MLERLNKVEERYEELTRLMADPDVAQDYERVAQYAKERADLQEIVIVYHAYKETSEELEETKTLLTSDADPELRELAEEAITQHIDYTALDATRKAEELERQAFDWVIDNFRLAPSSDTSSHTDAMGTS